MDQMPTRLELDTVRYPTALPDRVHAAPGVAGHHASCAGPSHRRRLARRLRAVADRLDSLG